MGCYGNTWDVMKAYGFEDVGQIAGQEVTRSGVSAEIKKWLSRSFPMWLGHSRLGTPAVYAA